jgi:hypothetical protein
MITANRTERARRERATGERAPHPDEEATRHTQNAR